MTRTAKSSGLAIFVLLVTIGFASLYAWHVVLGAGLMAPTLFSKILLAVKTCLEIGAIFYLLSFFSMGLSYLLFRERSEIPAAGLGEQLPPVGILYLCCNDLDWDAVQKFQLLQYPGKIHFIIHDDSTNEEARAEVDAAAESLRRRSSFEVLLLRRTRREGGKPGAVNYVLAETGHLYEYFLLCDNDSTICDSSTVEKALAYFQNAKTAVVQCRSTAAESESYSKLNRLLSGSINIFDVFLTSYARFGWTPFIGHNAFLRTRAVLDVGGLTPGFFSDDLDLTLRLNLKGYSIVYAPNVHLGEKHPPSYGAFRKRNYKWAYGCMQVLRAHWRAALTTRELSFAEKLSFFQITGFYVMQAFLIVYLATTFLLAPIFFRSQLFSITSYLAIGLMLLVAVFFPALCYFATAAGQPISLGSVLACGLVYGTADFPGARGVMDCLLRRKREWTPTNGAAYPLGWSELWFEITFGLSCLIVPLMTDPSPLYFPCAYLFLGKFLFTPAISALYQDHEAVRTPRLASVAVIRRSLPLIALAAVLGVGAGNVQAEDPAPAESKRLYVDGREFTVRGVHYGPWRPGTGPNKQYPYPGPDLIEQDLRVIRTLNANTIEVYDPPGYVLDLAQKYDLKVLYIFAFDWWTLGDPGGQARKEEILRRVAEFRSKPAILGWVLGNEAQEYLIKQRGPERIEAGLRELYTGIKRIDNRHFVTHANWPVGIHLRLDFLDVISFNVYPLWPREVVTLGFGNYIGSVLQKAAADKPLLITEFGVNSLETSPERGAEILRECWAGLRKAGASGGVVFEFADEWWKNYDNPKNPDPANPASMWDRDKAPNDEKQHDQDPEENYGLMTSDRQPKPAFAAVQEMFGSESGTTSNPSWIPLGIISGMIVLAFIVWASARAKKVRMAPIRAETKTN